jgi:hippurate hydrolase
LRPGSPRTASARRAFFRPAMWFSTRSFSKKTRELLLERFRDLITAQAESFGVGVQIEHNHGCPVLENDPAFTRLARDVALQHHGAKRVAIHADQMPFSDDFAFMLQCRPGSYIVIGGGESRPLHHPAYDFNDRLLLIGATYWIDLVENYLMNG